MPTPAEIRKLTLEGLLAARAAMLSTRWKRALQTLPRAEQEEAARLLLQVQQAILQMQNAKLADLRDQFMANEKDLGNRVGILRTALKSLENTTTAIKAIGALLMIVTRVSGRPRIAMIDGPGNNYAWEGEGEGAGTPVLGTTRSRRPAAHASPPVADPNQREDGRYDVWFGTNRKPNDPRDAAKGFSGERDKAVHYGMCQVYVPKSHKIGSIGSPWWKRILTGQDDRLKLVATEEMAAAGYWKRIASQIARQSEGERHAVVMVHGYNVSFEAAALRAAQIGFDLSIKGAMAFFSWPSQGTLGGYAADAATIEVSEPAIAEFMTDFVERSGAKAVHVIAHSMGNRGVLAAVERIAAQAKKRMGKQFGQVILAAADVDADLFRQRCDAYKRIARQTTLYVSAKDLAVEAAKWLHKFPRVGLSPPVFVTPGIDTISVQNVDMTMLGHGYVAEARDVLMDMHQLIFDGHSPSKRTFLRSTKTETGERYWLIGA